MSDHQQRVGPRAGASERAGGGHRARTVSRSDRRRRGGPQVEGRRPTGPRDGDEQRSVTELVEQPAKVMRIGSMIRQLLEEVTLGAARRRQPQPAQGDPPGVDQGARGGAGPRAGRGARAALAAVHRGRRRPSDAELRIAQAQLVGWLEGLFHGIQTAIYAQQMAARAAVRADPARRCRRGRDAGGGARAAAAGRAAAAARRATPAGCTSSRDGGRPTGGARDQQQAEQPDEDQGGAGSARSGTSAVVSPATTREGRLGRRPAGSARCRHRAGPRPAATWAGVARVVPLVRGGAQPVAVGRDEPDVVHRRARGRAGRRRRFRRGRLARSPRSPTSPL